MPLQALIDKVGEASFRRLEEETILMTGGDWEENTDQQALELSRRKAAGLISAAPAPIGINGKPNNTIPPGEEGEPGADGKDGDQEDGGPKK